MPLLEDRKALGVLITGQSLAEGGMGQDAVAQVRQPVAPDQAFMLTGGPVGIQRSTLTLPLVPLRDAKKRVTVASSLAHQLLGLNSLAGAKLVISGQAWGGKPYQDLRKGSSSGFNVYEQCLEQVAAAASALPGLHYRALVIIHGEQDGLLNNTGYEADLLEWQAQFEADIQRITGQEECVHMFLCQTSTAGGYGFNGGIDEQRFPTTLAQLAAHRHSPKISLVCPKYFLPYADYAHISNLGQRILGEYYAKAIAAHFAGREWEPLRPRSFSVRGDRILVDFIVPQGELEFDVSLVRPAAQYGFDYRDAAGNVIQGVEKTGPAQVSIYLSGPAASDAWLAYAYCNGEGQAAQVEGLGDRGNLRDQDETMSRYEPHYRLFNWCCSFREQVC